MRKSRFLNIHTVLLFLVILTIAVLVIRFFTWGKKVDLEQFASEYSDDKIKDTMDVLAPVLDENGDVVKDKDDVTTIVCFGNAPFADDRDTPGNLANLIASKAGATVYNCSIGRSLLSAKQCSVEFTEEPLDFFSPYWLMQVALKAPMEDNWNLVRSLMGDTVPPEAQEVYDTLRTLDFNTVDVVAIMYDASDYLAGRPIYNDNDSSDLAHFTGNLEATIGLIQQFYPHIRVIVMSPAYAYAVDDSGKYVSSDMYTYGYDVLSTYAIKEYDSCMVRGVTFLDNIYGTLNEDTADEYLTDNLHLNAKGRELIADHFVEALQYYDFY